MPTELAENIFLEEIALLCRSSSKLQIEKMIVQIEQILAKFEERVRSGERLSGRERVSRNVLERVIKRLQRRIAVMDKYRAKQKEQRLKERAMYQMILAKVREEEKQKEQNKKDLEDLGENIFGRKLAGKIIHTNNPVNLSNVIKLSLEELEAIDPDAAIIAKKIRGENIENTAKMTDTQKTPNLKDILLSFENPEENLELEGDVL